MKSEKLSVLTLGNGITVVLLHSAMSSKLQWYKLMYSMNKEYQMIAVDLYGYGEAPFPDNPETFCLSDEISMVETLIADIIPGDTPFHLVGHSYGASVGLRWCYKNPERFLSMSLYEPVAYHLLPKDGEVLEKVRQEQDRVDSFVQKGEYKEGAQQFIDAWNGPGTFASYPKEVQDLFLQGAKKLPLGFRALMDEPLTLEDYSRLDVPVCLMAGQKSPLSARTIAQLLSENLKDCRFHWINAAHMAPVTNPELVNPIIESFIRGIR